MLQSQPASLQLRYLQTLTEIAAENNSTTIFPIPIDLLKPFFQRADDSIAAPTPAGAGLPPAIEPSAFGSGSLADALPHITMGRLKPKAEAVKPKDEDEE
jgi:hypothetical protein